MRRRAFLINSSVLILLIPLMLLMATYEEVSYQVVQAQGERIQIDRTSQVLEYLEADFKKALEISARRAIISTTEYVATKDFIQGQRANDTIAQLIVWGQSSLGIESDQNLKIWLSNITEILAKQGFVVSPSVSEILSEMTITVAPLDSFRVAVIARLPEITIMDSSGSVIYSGTIPSNRNATAIISIEGVEDTFISRETYDLYHRLIKACMFPYPELTGSPIIRLNGTGSSPQEIITGIYGETIQFNETRIWTYSDTGIQVTITELDQDPTEIIKNGDTGVLVFDDIGETTGPKAWSVTTQDEWENNTDSGTHYNIFSEGLTIGKHWRVLWNDPNLYHVSGDKYRRIITLPAIPKAIEYRWDTELKVDRKWWNPKARIKLKLSSEVEVTTKKTTWDHHTIQFTETPSKRDIFLRGDTLFGLDTATGYTQNNVITGYVYYTNGGWISKVWNPRLTRPAQIQSLNVTTSIGNFEIIYLEVGVDTNGDEVMDYWTSPLYLHNGFNSLTLYDINLPEGYTWQIKFKLKTTDPNDLSHAPSVVNYTLKVKPSETPSGPNARAYDIQSFVSCLENGYYFGLYNAPSFFERLEGNFDPAVHREYEELANRTQDLLGVSTDGQHYPIGLVSFILPSQDKIKLILATAGLDPKNPNPDGQSCLDYYFLKYYLENDPLAKREGYKMYGVSAGTVVIDNNFYIDRKTALAIFGNDLTATNDLLTTG
ncbi:hypothetical protein FH039_02265 [Thermococcus indicus]|uniref:Uncharacterized protein n=1 Tax=Thermococcus indicus TaxID=2586643 RepID=A0A4Y5SKF8_9EURY|nr:hypothetical protein [Thermococcus indicus]QDA30672.1 hypothetical protein FH039_02265 [Thermococcus indicus]